MTEAKVPHCCFLLDQEKRTPCPNRAEWTILQGPDFHQDMFTLACTTHVGPILSDAYEHRVFAILGERGC